MSDILNTVLQGETVSGNQELYQIGLSILEKEGNLKLNQYEVTTETRGQGDMQTTITHTRQKSKDEMVDPASR